MPLGLDVPFPVAAPVLVGLRVGLHLLEEPRLVDAAHREHHRDRHHLVLRRVTKSARRRERRCRRRRWRRSPAWPGSPRRPALLSTITPRKAPPSMIGATPRRCSIGVTPASCDEHVGHVLERLGVERVAQRLRLGLRGAHGLGALLELASDALAVDGLLVPVPGQPLDPDLGDVAAEAAVAVDERGLDAARAAPARPPGPPARCPPPARRFPAPRRPCGLVRRSNGSPRKTSSGPMRLGPAWRSVTTYTVRRPKPLRRR